MSSFLNDLPALVLRTSLFLALSALIVWGLLALTRPRSPIVHRMAWCFVLFQGILLARLPIEIPWYDPPPTPSYSHLDDEWPDLSALESPAGAETAATTSVLYATAPSRPSWTWKKVALVVWLTGMAAILGIALLGYGILLRALRRTVTAPDEWQDQWKDLLAEHGVRAAIPLLVHNRLGPILCRTPGGYQVVVPRRLWEGFTPAQRLAILQHELAHYLRNDIWKSLLARLVALAHWFNPFAWWAVRKFDEGGEWACDQQLAEAHPYHVPDFARALLQLVEPVESAQVCASSARGASLSVRIRRLLACQLKEDSAVKRLMVSLVLLGLTLVGLTQIKLVARDDEKPERPAPAADLAPRIDAFARKLVVAGDPELAKFQQALQTRVGKIVVQDRTAHIEAQLREQALVNAVPNYIKERFVEENGAFRLRPGQDAMKEELVRIHQTFTEDVAKIKPVAEEIGNNLADDSEINKLLARFLKHEAAPSMVYVLELRQKVRPSVAAIEEQLGEIFVKDQEGKYVIRDSRRDEAEKFLDRAGRVVKGVERLHKELKAYAKEFAEPDDFHKQLKKAAVEPLFAAHVGIEVFEGDDPIQNRLDRFFDQLEEITRDTADGIVVMEDEAKREIEEVLKRYVGIQKGAERLRAPLAEFAGNIRTKDDLHRQWQETLKSDIALIKLTHELGLASANPGELLRDMIGQALTKDDQGTYRVNEEAAEEVNEAVQQMFRQYRQLRRRGRVIDEFAEKLEDSDLKAIYSSTAGKFAVLHAVRRSLNGGQFDGLNRWIAEHFEETSEGLVLKEGAREVVRDYLNDVENVKKELEKNDF